MTPDQPSPKEFRDALRALVGTCSVITTGTGDKATGLVVTSAISLSAEPPLLLACVNRSSSSWQVLKDSGIFGWSCLGAAHQCVPMRKSQSSSNKVERYVLWLTRRSGVTLCQKFQRLKCIVFCHDPCPSWIRLGARC